MSPGAEPASREEADGMNAKLGRIDHIGIAVPNLAEAKRVFCDSLGLPCADEQAIPERGVKVAFLSTANTTVELLEGIDETSAVSKFVAQRGPGIHHLCFEVPDIRDAMKTLRASGMRLVDEEPRPGAEGKLVAFLHPKSTLGVLIELIEP
jgi:methylmalonyl-CoA/ethylmalonyl-CoA epimerase